MGTNKEYLIFILDQLSLINKVTYKKMMGEYLLYKDNILVGGIYDDRLLLKITKSNIIFNFQKEIPYPNGKETYLIDDVDNKEQLMTYFLNTYNDLKK